MFAFRVEARAGRARTGRLTTPHGAPVLNGPFYARVEDGEGAP